MLNVGGFQGVAASGPRTMRDRIAGIWSNEFVRNVGIMSSGSALGHLFTLAAGPVLTRIYSPEEFGALGLFTSLLSILVVAVTLQYEISIVIGRDEQEAAYLTFGSLLIALPSSLLSGAILWSLIHWSLLGYGTLRWYAPLLLTCSMLFIGCFTALRYWSLRDGQFRWIAQAAIAQSAGRAILQALFGVIGLRASGLLAGEMLGRGMGMSRMLRSSWPVLREHARRFRWSELQAALRRHSKFPLYSFPSSFLDALCLGLPLPLLVHMYGVSLGGQYSLVWKAITVPAVLISTSVADTFHNSLATFVREAPERVPGLFRATSLALFLIGLVPATILIFWGPGLFGLVFGARWALAGSIAAIIAPWYLAQFVASPLSRVVVVLSGQETKLIWDMMCLVSLAGVFLAARYMGLSSLQTIRVLSAAYTMLFVAYYLILRSIVLRFERMRCAATQPC